MGAAQEKGIMVTFALTGSCSPIDPAYFKIADETGGQLFFLDTSEIGEIFTLVEPELSGDFVTIFSTNGTLSNSNRKFNVSLDSSLSKAVFSVSHFFDTGARRDVDHYAFLGKAGDVITADVSAYRIGSPLYYSQLSLYASDGTTLLAQNIDWYGYNGYDPKISYVLHNNGIYYLGVSDIYGRTGSAYYYTLTLTINGISTVIDIGNEVEPNNSISNATNISYGNLIHGDLGYVPPEQVPVKVFRPSGIAVSQGELGVTITSLNYGTVVSVESPQPGVWSFDISGTGEYAAKVMGNSSIQFESFQFVERYDMADSTAYFPIAGQPVIGKAHIGQATLFGNFKSASFKLITEQGDTIQPIDLKQGDMDASPGDFVGSITLPNSSFRVAVSGIDQNGKAFSRVFPTLFSPQGIQVVPDVTTSSLREGRTDIIEFVVTNFGNRGTFEVFVTDNRGFIRDVNPRVLTLDNGFSARVEVAVTVPFGTTTGTDVLLSVSVSNTSDPNIFNSASIILTVINNLPPIANAGTDQVVSAGTLVTLNGRDSVDPDYGPNPLAFAWEQTAGPVLINLTGSNTATPTFTPVTAGDYTFSLVVSDGEYDSVPDTVIVIVYPINWAIVKLLPSTPNNKAGRTMPVKFSLIIDSSVETSQPFIYSEDIKIMIYQCNNTICSSKTLMQTSVYGSSDTDCRIDPISKLYITNFKTIKTPANYMVEVWGPNNSMVGSFTFKTDK